MAVETEMQTSRKPRADALRNRAQLLEAAKAAFAEKGAAASLEEIARGAGVGIGTLYRHFPTRDALIADVYRNETDQIVAAAARFAETLPPIEALREWLLLFVDFMSTKYGMMDALNSIAGGASDLFAASSAHVKQATGKLVERGTASGELRVDMDPLTLLWALGGVAKMSSGDGWQAEARRLVDVLIAGVRS
ncbi:AcrR family transcriptional regulator [Sphingomonas zeicaulis]|uniref:TetR/AcrR family transcriptional regulator n=1 Tax=Sphingomonas zeicaulis TaxID=1632740 RepID=UPI003D1BFFDA